MWRTPTLGNHFIYPVAFLGQFMLRWAFNPGQNHLKLWIYFPMLAWYLNVDSSYHCLVWFNYIKGCPSRNFIICHSTTKPCELCLWTYSDLDCQPLLCSLAIMYWTCFVGITLHYPLFIVCLNHTFLITPHTLCKGVKQSFLSVCLVCQFVRWKFLNLNIDRAKWFLKLTESLTL